LRARRPDERVGVSISDDIRRRLRIETIDAFNTWLAGQLPVMAGAGLAFCI